METYEFSALGTQWSLLVDHDTFSEAHRKEILDEVALFERRFSRFLPKSEVNQFRNAVAGTYPLTEEFSRILLRASRLRELTNGIYDPAIGRLLEHAGYGPEYSLKEDALVATYELPRWTLRGGELTIGGPTVFDFGGIGKGYCIDLVARALKRLGYQYFLVEGGGDMYGTTKRDGRPYRVALEWPGKSDLAFGVVELRFQAVAVSDSFKRRWKTWHHIIDPHAKKPIESVIGATAIAKNAFDADCMTSGLFLTSSQNYASLVGEFKATYAVFQRDGTMNISPDWQGELF